MTTPLSPQQLLEGIVAARRAARALRHTPHRDRLLRTEAALRAALGPAVPKAAAARALGVSRGSLERWIERGAVPVSGAPGTARPRLEAGALIELLDRVETRRDRGRRGRLLEASVQPTHRAQTP